MSHSRGASPERNELMSRPSVNAFIQARMSSTRFPGKVLEVFRGEPIVRHVIAAVEAVPEIERFVILTSVERSDDPLVSYLEQLGVDVFRGPLEDVFGRFQQCAAVFPSNWILRLCADSPLIEPAVISAVARHAADGNCDVATTRLDPPFPKGQNADLFRASTLRNVDPADLTDQDREHVITYFLRHRDRFRIASTAKVPLSRSETDFTVDKPEDLQRLERLLAGVDH